MSSISPASITVSAPGKIHLIGEQVVVYGKPALLAAIDKRVFIQVRHLPSDRDPHLLHVGEAEPLIQHSLKIFQDAFRLETLPSLEITLKTDLPFGSGLGSSAALAVATMGALMRSVKGQWNPTKIHELAFEVEKFAHGNPSGADVTAVANGGLIWFRKEFSFLKSIWALPMQQYTIPALLLIDSGRPVESTKEMVAQVAETYAKDPARTEMLFADQEHQTKRLVMALREKNLKEFTETLSHAQRNLELLGVVGERAKKIIATITAAGGVAKISGAGGKQNGSGMLLCYHENIQILRNLAEEKKWQWLDIQPGEEGVRIETSI